MRMLRIISVVGTALSYAGFASPEAAAQQTTWERTEIDNVQGMVRWGDINGDGHADVLWNQDWSGMTWYESPDWTRHDLWSLPHWAVESDDFDTYDIDGDGDQDIVQPERTNWHWYENPSWEKHLIGDHGTYSKDVEFVDLDGDGKRDLVVKGHGVLNVFFQNPLSTWTRRTVTSNTGSEGMGRPVDLDGDHFRDIAVDGHYYKNPGGSSAQIRTGSWKKVTFDASAPHETMTRTCDVDRDGDFDIVMTGAEGGSMEPSWYENDGNGAFSKHPLKGSQDSTHTLDVGDVDGDGDIDILIGAMGGVLEVFVNDGAQAFASQTVDTSACYQALLADFDNDGDLDITTCRNWNAKPLFVYENKAVKQASTSKQWSFKIVTNSHERAFGLSFGDFNRDGFAHILSKGYWYRNPGDEMTGTWNQNALPSGDALAAADVDGDTDLVSGEHEGSLRVTVWENDGQGSFAAREVDRGKESHLGARVFDLDGDGDLDIVSIAWTNPENIHLWRNDNPAVGRKVATGDGPGSN